MTDVKDKKPVSNKEQAYNDWASAKIQAVMDLKKQDLLSYISAEDVASKFKS